LVEGAPLVLAEMHNFGGVQRGTQANEQESCCFMHG
jgi:hypothetical protein